MSEIENQRITAQPSEVGTENDGVLELSSKLEPTPANSVFEDPELIKAIDSIPDKMAFKIGEVAEIAGVQPYVLRYWETEFDELRPKKSTHNQRMYSRHDTKMVLMIKKLLHKDRFSIEGARKALRRLRVEVKKEVKKETKIKVISEKSMRACGIMSDLVDDLEGLRKLFS